MVGEEYGVQLAQIVAELKAHFGDRAHEVAQTEVERARRTGSPALAKWVAIARQLEPSSDRDQT